MALAGSARSRLSRISRTAVQESVPEAVGEEESIGPRGNRERHHVEAFEVLRVAIAHASHVRKVPDVTLLTESLGRTGGRATAGSKLDRPRDRPRCARGPPCLRARPGRRPSTRDRRASWTRNRQGGAALRASAIAVGLKSIPTYSSHRSPDRRGRLPIARFHIQCRARGCACRVESGRRSTPTRRSTGSRGSSPGRHGYGCISFIPVRSVCSSPPRTIGISAVSVAIESPDVSCTHSRSNGRTFRPATRHVRLRRVTRNLPARMESHARSSSRRHRWQRSTRPVTSVSKISRSDERPSRAPSGTYRGVRLPQRAGPCTRASARADFARGLVPPIEGAPGRRLRTARRRADAARSPCPPRRSRNSGGTRRQQARRHAGRERWS